uniref:Prephenate dehydratase domain-containing protein n=1 Tax=Daucus carota subsp. sativus TaxID=79200 RepID=A0A162A5K3_DAUCS
MVCLFQGIPGSYSEDAVLLAYPRCETVPSDKFEDAFKLVGSNKLEDVGIIASSRVAKMYGLDLLTENIQEFASSLRVLGSYPWADVSKGQQLPSWCFENSKQ